MPEGDPVLVEEAVEDDEVGGEADRPRGGEGVHQVVVERPDGAEPANVEVPGEVILCGTNFMGTPLIAQNVPEDDDDVHVGEVANECKVEDDHGDVAEGLGQVAHPGHGRRRQEPELREQDAPPGAVRDQTIDLA